MFNEVRGTDDTQYIPHPSTHWKSLEREVLRELEKQIAQVKDGSQPVINAQLKTTSYSMENSNQLYLHICSVDVRTNSTCRMNGHTGY